MSFAEDVGGGLSGELDFVERGLHFFPFCFEGFVAGFLGLGVVCFDLGGVNGAGEGGFLAMERVARGFGVVD